MMTFYAAAGSYQIRNEDGKDMPYIMRLGKLQPVSIPEFSIWSMLLWDVLTHDELRKKYFEKMEEVKLDPSGFEKALEMLVKRKLIIKGVGYTGVDALYNMLYDTYVIPLRGVQGTRRLLNIAKLLKQGKVNFFEAVYLLQPDKGTEAEQRIMKLVTQTPLSVPELVRCFENDVRDVSSADKVISAIYTEESDNQARLNNACIEQLEIDGDEERREHLTSIECAWEQRVHWAACHSFYCGYRAAVKVLTAVEGVSTFDMIPHTLLLEYHLGYTKSYDQTEQQHIDR